MGPGLAPASGRAVDRSTCKRGGGLFQQRFGGGTGRVRWLRGDRLPSTALPLGRKGTRAAQAAIPSPVQTRQFSATRPGGYSLPGLTGKAVLGSGGKVWVWNLSSGHAVAEPLRGQ